MNHSGIDLFRKFSTGFHVARVNSSAETEGALIRDANGFLLRVKGHNAYSRSKHFVLSNRHVWLHVREDSGRNEIPLYFPAQRNFCALFDGLLDLLAERCRLILVDQWTNVRLLFYSIAHFEPGDTSHIFLEKLWIQAAMHENAI